MPSITPLIVVSYALKPGPGGAEAYVNEQFLKALYEQRKEEVYVIHGGKENAQWMKELQGWTFYPYKVRGVLSTLNELRTGNWIWHLLWKVFNKLVHWKNGYGLKMKSWELFASGTIKNLLQNVSNPVIYSRVLPFQSMNAVGVMRNKKTFKWIVNINDPLPPDIWTATYQIMPKAIRKWKPLCEKWFEELDGVSYASEGLKSLQEKAYPNLKGKPSVILPHITISNASKTQTVNLFRLVYIGSLPKRNQSKQLKKGLELFLKTKSNRSLEISFHLPTLTEVTREFINSLPVISRGVISETETDILEALGNADGFLFMGFDGDQPLLYTKLPSYILSKKPIIGFAPSDSITAKLLKEQSAAFISDLNDSKSFSENLEHLVNNNDEFEFDEHLQNTLTPSKIIQDYLEFEKSLLE